MDPKLFGLGLIIFSCVLLLFVRYHSEGRVKLRVSEHRRQERGVQGRRELLERVTDDAASR